MPNVLSRQNASFLFIIMASQSTCLGGSWTSTFPNLLNCSNLLFHNMLLKHTDNPYSSLSLPTVYFIAFD